jgi:hypothetical protein
MHPNEIGVSGGDALKFLFDDVLDAIDQLLHGCA